VASLRKEPLCYVVAEGQAMRGRFGSGSIRRSGAWEPPSGTSRLRGRRCAARTCGDQAPSRRMASSAPGRYVMGYSFTASVNCPVLARTRIRGDCAGGRRPDGSRTPAAPHSLLLANAPNPAGRAWPLSSAWRAALERSFAGRRLGRARGLDGQATARRPLGRRVAARGQAGWLVASRIGNRPVGPTPTTGAWAWRHRPRGRRPSAREPGAWPASGRPRSSAR
jgi:hypothetical protein